MAVKVDNNTSINSYIVNQLFGQNHNNTGSSGNLINTLQSLSEDYAEISSFGQKLNDIYNTLTENNATDETLQGARQVFLSLIQNPNGLSGLEMVNTISNLSNKPETMNEFFSLSNQIHNQNLNLNGWLEAFEHASNYGYTNDFLNQTSAIVNNPNNSLVKETFNNFLEGVIKASTNTPAEELTKQYLSTLFSGLNQANSLQAKNEFLQNFMNGFG